VGNLLGGGLGDLLVGLGEDKLDVAGVGHVGVDLETMLEITHESCRDPIFFVVKINLHDRERGLEKSLAMGHQSQNSI
jgi:hypothetical protein